MAEREPFGPSKRPETRNSAFPSYQTIPLDQPGAVLGAKRPLDGEDRSGTIQDEGKRELQQRWLAQRNGFATIRPQTRFQGLRNCETALQNQRVLQCRFAMLIGYARVSTDDQTSPITVGLLRGRLPDHQNANGNRLVRCRVATFKIRNHPGRVLD